MKKKLHLSIWALAASIIFSAGVLAQEKTEVSIRIKKDGKIVKDTTYQFEDDSEAKHAVKMLELLSGEDIHKEHFEGNHSKAMVFISEDGEKTEIKEFHGDSHVWIQEDEDDGDEKILDKNENVIVIKEGDDVKTEIVKIMKEQDGKEDSHVKVIVIKKSGDEDCDHDKDVEVKVVKKKVKKENK